MDGYMSEIRLFGGTFAPMGYMLCQGQLLSIAENTALFALLGTMYGGDGQTTFALPDLRGRMPVGTGQGPGLSPIDEGQVGGTEATSMTNATMPSHNHSVTVTALRAAVQLKAYSTPGGTDSPAGAYLAGGSDLYIAPASADLNMAGQPASGTLQLGLSGTGGSLPFNNRSPYLGLNYIICTEGIFPSRN